MEGKHMVNKHKKGPIEVHDSRRGHLVQLKGWYLTEITKYHLITGTMVGTSPYSTGIAHKQEGGKGPVITLGYGDHRRTKACGGVMGVTGLIEQCGVAVGGGGEEETQPEKGRRRSRLH